MLGHFLELIFFICADIAEFAFRKTVDKKSFIVFAKKNNAAVSLGFTFSGTGYPLLDNAAAQVRINLSFFSPFYRIPKCRSWNFFFSDKAGKPRIFENLQVQNFRIKTKFYNTRCDVFMPCQGTDFSNL